MKNILSEHRIKAWLPWLIFASLLALHAWLGWDAASKLGATSDEPAHISYGYSYWALGSRQADSTSHPPLPKLWLTLPLLILRPDAYAKECGWQWNMADSVGCTRLFFFHNRIPAQTMLLAARCMNLLLSLPLALGIFFFTRSISNWQGGLLAVFWMILCPSILANASVAATDQTFMLTFFWSCLSFARLNQNPGVKTSLVAGISLGLALASKATGIFLPPILLLIFLFHTALMRPAEQQKRIGCAGVAVFAAFLTLGLVYFPDTLNNYFRLFKAQTINAVLKDEPISMYFHGDYIPVNNWLIFLNLLIKTPLPLVLLSAAGAAFFAKNYKLSFSKGLEFVVLPPIAVILISIFIYKLQLYNRYVLFIYPMLCALAGGFLGNVVFGKHFAPSRRPASIVLAVAVLWYSVSSLRIHPYYLGFYNPLIGSAKNGYQWFNDSNVNWGTSELKEFAGVVQKERVSALYLHAPYPEEAGGYGIFHLSLIDGRPYPPEKSVEPHETNPIWLATDVTFLQQEALIYHQPLFQWLLARKPDRVVGLGFFVYDITGEA
ncbi:MAG: glycosyltransferase family 39 protein, partial [Elusimicrobia bacterium]|nr:glycosyltransferase family 39 protein [Elusimicrobiota bacterium]